jgi:hypothetical protein
MNIIELKIRGKQLADKIIDENLTGNFLLKILNNKVKTFTTKLIKNSDKYLVNFMIDDTNVDTDKLLEKLDEYIFVNTDTVNILEFMLKYIPESYKGIYDSVKSSLPQSIIIKRDDIVNLFKD